MFNPDKTEILMRKIARYLSTTSLLDISKRDEDFSSAIKSNQDDIESILHEANKDDSKIILRYDEVDPFIKRFINRRQSERIALCSKNLKAKNPKISLDTARSLCETVNGILKAPDRRDVPEKFDSFLHKWFLSDSVTEEILKTINSKDLCFLHSVEYSFTEKKFYILKQIGRDNESIEEIDFEKYYKNQIQGCESNLMAIHFTYFWQHNPHGHATTVVIEKGKKRSDGKQLIIVEHFDSSNIDGEEIKEPLEYFIKSLFGEDDFYFEFYHQDKVCNSGIQGYLLGTPFFGSCTQFALWYGFKRLLEPDRTRNDVVTEMYTLLHNNDPETVMINLIKQFQSLLNIKISENDELDVETNGRNIKLLSYELRVEEHKKKLKKYEEALQSLSKSNSEKEWEDVYKLHDEIDNLRFAYRWQGEYDEQLETKWNELNIIKRQLHYKKKLEKYEDALQSLSKSNSEKDWEDVDKLNNEIDILRIRNSLRGEFDEQLETKWKELNIIKQQLDYKKKMKKYEDALESLSKSNSEKEWEDVDELYNEIDNLRFNYNWLKEFDPHLETKWKELRNKKEELDNIQMFHNGFKPFREALEEYEDALNRCKTSSSKEACKLADNLQVNSDLLANTAKFYVVKGQPQLMENKKIADLVVKYEQLFQEHMEMKNSTKPKTVIKHVRPTGANVSRLAAIYDKKPGGKNTKRKKRPLRKQKGAKKSLKKSRH
jgi:hypothetical protein